jgi:hypothetical protein
MITVHDYWGPSYGSQLYSCSGLIPTLKADSLWTSYVDRTIAMPLVRQCMWSGHDSAHARSSSLDERMHARQIYQKYMPPPLHPP